MAVAVASGYWAMAMVHLDIIARRERDDRCTLTLADDEQTVHLETNDAVPKRDCRVEGGCGWHSDIQSTLLPTCLYTTGAWITR